MNFENIPFPGKKVNNSEIKPEAGGAEVYDLKYESLKRKIDAAMDAKDVGENEKTTISAPESVPASESGEAFDDPNANKHPLKTGADLQNHFDKGKSPHGLDLIM